MGNVGELKKYLSEAVLVELKGVQVCVDLKGQFTLSEVDLDANVRGLMLKTEQRVLLRVEWSELGRALAKMMDWQSVSAKFVKRKDLLKITCPFKSQ